MTAGINICGYFPGAHPATRLLVLNPVSRTTFG